jgi:hypothetical protein
VNLIIFYFKKIQYLVHGARQKKNQQNLALPIIEKK